MADYDTLYNDVVDPPDVPMAEPAPRGRTQLCPRSGEAGLEDGDRRKSMLAGCLFFLLFISVIAVSTILGRAGDTNDLDDPTTLRRAVAVWWGNKSVDPCVDFYNYSCQGYERMAPVGLSILGQTHVRVVGKDQPRAPTVNVSSIMEVPPSEIGIFPFYTVETRWQNVYIYPITEEEEDTANPSRSHRQRPERRRRTLEQMSLQRITTPAVVNASSAIVNDTLATFNAWIHNLDLSVWMVNDKGLTDDIDDSAWFLEGSHASIDNISAEATDCMVQQIRAGHWYSMFYDPHLPSVGVVNNTVVEAVLGRVAALLRPMNPVFAGIAVHAGGPDPPCTHMTSNVECLRCPSPPHHPHSPPRHTPTHHPHSPSPTRHPTILTRHPPLATP